MAQGSPRTRFNSSALVRVLGELAVAEVAEPKQSFAERLGQWLDFNDALALFSALNAGASAVAEAQPAARLPERAAARQAFDRVRAILNDAIAGDAALDPAKARNEQPSRGAPGENATDFAPFHRCYLAHQRDMNAKIAPLRASVRTALSRQSAALKRLAVLDAVLEQALAARERDLLATVPALLARRFEQLHKAHQSKLAETQLADDPALWARPGGWLAVFCKDVQAVLRAELALRLQPVAGLVAALENEVTSKQ